MSARWLVLLGEASFALYLIHIPVYHLLSVFHLQPSPFVFLGYLAACVALSIVCFLYFESPSRRLIAAWLSAKQLRPDKTQKVQAA